MLKTRYKSVICSLDRPGVSLKVMIGWHTYQSTHLLALLLTLSRALIANDRGLPKVRPTAFKGKP